MAVCVCFLVAVASLCHAGEPQAKVLVNGASFTAGDYFSATFQLNTSITRALLPKE